MPDDLTPLRAFLRPPEEAPSPFAEVPAILASLPEPAQEQILAAFQKVNERRSAAEAQAMYYQGRMQWGREALQRLYSVARELEEPCDCEACPQCALTRALDAADDALNHLPKQ